MEPKPLENFKNYFMYEQNVRNLSALDVFVPTDITLYNIDQHIDAISNILQDGIETDYVHNTKNRISWGGDMWCHLTFVDYWYNLFMWWMILKTDGKILPRHVFWQKELKKKDIKKFIDKFVLIRDNKIKYGHKYLCNVLADGTWAFSKIEPFALYLANTINNEDDIALMKACPEYNQLMHTSFDNIPFAEVKDYGQSIADKTIEIIKDSSKYLGYEHGLTNSFRASEAINPRQYKESRVSIGTKSAYGVVYPVIINHSFSNGGVNKPLWLFIESNSARFAQILSKQNVGDSGDFARILNLNNIDTILYPNPTYRCGSRHYIKYQIKTEKHLSMIKDRYYRFQPNGVQYLIDDEDFSLVGKEIYLRSPMTCSSMSHGKGICSCCYGDLYYTNRNINVGVNAAEILSSKLTQRLLSAKHLLETIIQTMTWNKEFYDLFNVDINAIGLKEDIEDTVTDLRRYSLLINPDDVILVNNEEDAISYEDESTSDDEDEETETVRLEDSVTYNEYVTKFYIKTPSGEIIPIGTENEDQMFISAELNRKIRNKAVNDDGFVSVSLKSLTDTQLFYVKINNNELSKTMEDIIRTINKSEVTTNMTKDEILQTLVDLIIEGGLNIDSVHLEVILANQIVDANDVLKKPNWDSVDAMYSMLTLNQALNNNPSVIVSLLYKDLNKVLYNPLTFRKRGPSFFDSFFMEQPQNYMSDQLLIDRSEANIRDDETKIEMCRIVKE